MKAAILGGGFGLYGYLPALIECGVDVCLSERYRSVLLSRSDINGLASRVEWYKKDSIPETCTMLVVALPPKAQSEWIGKALEYPQISHLYLEKPLVPHPIEAGLIFKRLELSGKKFRIGYNFRFTKWGEQILKTNAGITRIKWNFKAHHYKNNIASWKRNPSEGGGALRFYGIHLVALLAELGYTDAATSILSAASGKEAEIWKARITGPALPDCSIEINSNASDSAFIVEFQGKHMQLSEPFQTEYPAEKADSRIPLLAQGIQSLLSEKEDYYPWYEGANKLWQNIEEKSIFEHLVK